ncbi:MULTISPECIES: ArsR/SmtB family transcription factor [Sphingobium]|jgi:DNA-binding transcriptional ArsR family regulator|uniref:Helix-turn-helix transcriptional regulator n=1 Tax=Sphingobium fuliginis (strain ATCC 27551) TaxID=336203 RepID=A0A4Q4ITN6_SPHSA|nr:MULTISPECIES: metalloregulator ArsR/SmtB family transcription factor [Sphingobium]QOT73836.1 helix-turn-helix transcriptional regulator [Sphingobium fuliginis]RYL96858.1 transcriptional regulator [Sphingobium fuliginis]WDA35909.1 metalloregulator ArsR/SmtB family transcription factor [Sphingobium sp. YC-XJ3]GFZ98190.1 hypothetical protein GCM10019071_30700 [Sphingobium fuliginis]
MADPIDRATATEIVERLRVFAQPQRLAILTALLQGEQSVAAIDAATGIGQPALSQQLGELRRAELVAQRRDAKSVVYRLIDERTAAVVRIVVAAFGSNDPLEAGIRREDAPARRAHVGSAAMFAVVDRS